MGVTVTFAWDFDGRASRVSGWAIYLSDVRALKGRRYSTVQSEARHALLHLEEGTWVARAVPFNSSGEEAQDWRSCPSTQFFAAGRNEEPAAPVQPAAGFVEPGASLRVMTQPVDMETPPGDFEVVALPADGAIVHASQGRLLATVPAMRLDLIESDPVRALANLVPHEGIGDGETRRIALRTLSKTGRAGDSSEITVSKPARPAHHGVTLATIKTSDGSHSGFPAAPSTQGFEYGTGYGARLKALPKWNDAGFDDLFDGLERIAPYVTNAKIRTSEVDVGAIASFVLELSDEVHREDQTGAFDVETMKALGSSGTLSPTDVPDIRRSSEHGGWMWREVLMDGTPRRPIRPENARWVYWISDTSPVSTSEGNAREYVPGAIVRGRYVVAELRLREPHGLHRVQTGNVAVVARIPRKISIGTGSPEGVVIGPPGDHYFRSDGAPWSYLKVTGVGATGWQSDIVDHLAAADPHPQYLTAAEGAAAYQPLDAELTALAGLTSAADKVPYFTGSGTASVSTLTSFARTLIDDVDAPTARSTLGLAIGSDVQAFDAFLASIAALGTAADKGIYTTGVDTAAEFSLTAFARTVLDDADAPTARSTLGVAIGTNVQAWDADLDAISALASAADKLPYATGAQTWSLATFTAAGRALVDDADATAQRVTLGLEIGVNVQAYEIGRAHV